MKELSLVRLYVLRAMYLFIVLGLGAFLWPDVITGSGHWGLSQGEAACMLAAFSLMCLLGLRYPVQMLPVLLWEVTWKTLWLALVPLPQYLAGHVDPAIKPAVFAIAMVVLVYAAVPWGFVFRRYVRADGERWLPVR
jgi:hypothetical protein